MKVPSKDTAVKVCKCGHCLEWHGRHAQTYGTACKFPDCRCVGYKFDHRERGDA